MTGNIFCTLTGHSIPNTVEDMTRIVELVIGKQVRVACIHSDMTASQSGIYPLSNEDPERAMKKIFPRIKRETI